MKRLMILALVAIGFSTSAQIVPVVNTTITKGYGNFSIDGRTYPMNSLIVNINTTDTMQVSFIAVNHCAQLPNDLASPMKRYSKYINGTTGLSFTSKAALKAYCDSFMYSH
jgi:hypothetical protein